MRPRLYIPPVTVAPPPSPEMYHWPYRRNSNWPVIGLIVGLYVCYLAAAAVMISTGSCNGS